MSLLDALLTLAGEADTAATCWRVGASLGSSPRIE